jgi:phage shock protein C
MQTVQNDIKAAPLPLRNDTILGVCEAIGEDFGFNANWLRLVFAATFYFAPVIVVSTYVGLGLLVAATRYFAPKQTATSQVASTADNSDQARLPLAA